MRRALALLLATAVSVAASPLAAAPQAAPPAAASPSAEPWLDEIMAVEDKLGPDDWRVPMLAHSSRRHENVRLASGKTMLNAFVAWPDTTARVPVVLVIPEDQGLNNWARDIADQIAAMGYIVVVPDMLSGFGPNGGGRESFPDLRSIFRMHSTLPQHSEPQLTAQLNFWADYAQKLPQANGKLAVAGFAWGGGRALWFAAQRKDLSAAFVFYDKAPPPDALRTLTAPVYGFYAAIDPRVTKSLADTKASMAALGKAYEQTVYPGTDHMFVRLGEEPRNTNPANILARHQSLARLQEVLAQIH